MPSPFPGMDPYLEDPELWPDVHQKLISEMQTALTPALRPRYVARAELRVYVLGEDDPGREAWHVPDVRIEEEIEEAFLEIRHVESRTTVAVIEVLSPSNKIRGSAGPGELPDEAATNPGFESSLARDRFVEGGNAILGSPCRGCQRLSSRGLAR